MANFDPIIFHERPRYPQIKVSLEGYWSNSFAVVARVVTALYFCGLGDHAAKQFMSEAADAQTRTQLLDVVLRWVSVS